tara:strand:+ start:3769 stop:11307 length:7539 start_codon:yes stop_codon:yes gene_type:complete
MVWTLSSIQENLGLKSPGMGLANLQLPERAPTSVTPPAVGTADFDQILSDISARYGGPKEPGGWKGGLNVLFRTLTLPGAVVRSTANETVDLLRGRGFSAGDWRTQVNERMGFLDLLANQGLSGEDIDNSWFGLGGWGKRIIGLTGDLFTDPLVNWGAGSAFWRGAVDDFTLTAGRYATVAANAGDDVTAGLVQQAVTAANASKSTGAALRSLQKEGSEAAMKVIDDLGIGYGNRVRVPGTGPVLRRLGNKLMPGWTAGRRVQQMPKWLRAESESLLRQLPEPATLNSVFRKLAGGKVDVEDAGKVLAQLTDIAPGRAAIMQASMRRAARMPVEMVGLKLSPYATERAGAVLATIAGGPGSLVSKIGGTNAGNFIRRTLQSRPKYKAQQWLREGIANESPQDIIGARIAMRGNGVANAQMGIWANNRTRGERAFRNEMEETFNIVDDDLLGWMTQAVEATDEVAARLGVPVDTLRGAQEIWERRVQAPLRESLRALYGDDSPAWRAIQDIIEANGAYSARRLSAKGWSVMKDRPDRAVGLDERGLEEYLADAARRGEPVDLTVKIMEMFGLGGGGAAWRTTGRGMATHLRKRRIWPRRVNATGDGFEMGSILTVEPTAGRTLDDLWAFVGGKEAAIARRMERGKKELWLKPKREWKPMSREDAVAEVDALVEVEYEVLRGLAAPTGATARPPRPGLAHPQGLSPEMQVDDLYRAAGHLEEGESLWVTNFAAREAAYLSSMARDVRLRSMENYMADQGIFLSTDRLTEYAHSYERLLAAGNSLQGQLDSLTSQEAHNMALIELWTGDASLLARGEGVKTIDYIEQVIGKLRGVGKEAEDELKNLVNEVSNHRQMLADIESEVGLSIDRVAQILGTFDGRYRFGGTIPAAPAAQRMIDAVDLLYPIIKELDPILQKIADAEAARSYLKTIIDTLSEVTEGAGVPGDRLRNIRVVQSSRLDPAMAKAVDAELVDPDADIFSVLAAGKAAPDEGLVNRYATEFAEAGGVDEPIVVTFAQQPVDFEYVPKGWTWNKGLKDPRTGRHGMFINEAGERRAPEVFDLTHPQNRVRPKMQPHLGGPRREWGAEFKSKAAWQKAMKRGQLVEPGPQVTLDISDDMLARLQAARIAGYREVPVLMRRGPVDRGVVYTIDEMTQRGWRAQATTFEEVPNPLTGALERKSRFDPAVYAGGPDEFAPSAVRGHDRQRVIFEQERGSGVASSRRPLRDPEGRLRHPESKPRLATREEVELLRDAEKTGGIETREMTRGTDPTAPANVASREKGLTVHALDDVPIHEAEADVFLPLFQDLEGQLAAPLDNLNDSLMPLLRQLLDEGMLSDSSVAAAKETIRIVTGKVGRARTTPVGAAMTRPPRSDQLLGELLAERMLGVRSTAADRRVITTAGDEKDLLDMVTGMHVNDSTIESILMRDAAGVADDLDLDAITDAALEATRREVLRLSVNDEPFTVWRSGKISPEGYFSVTTKRTVAERFSDGTVGRQGPVEEYRLVPGDVAGDIELLGYGKAPYLEQELIVSGRVLEQRRTSAARGMPFPIARHHKFKAEVMDSFAKTVDEIRTLDDLLENTVLGNPGLGTGLRTQAHEMGKRYKSALHRAQNLQGKGPVQFWGKGVYDLWMEPWSSAVAARGAGTVPPTVTNARKGGVFYHGRGSGPSSRPVRRGAPGVERLEVLPIVTAEEGMPVSGLHVGSRRAALERVSLRGYTMDDFNLHETPVFEVEVIPRRPYMPEGRILDESNATDWATVQTTDSQRRLLEEGYDVIPYRNSTEDTGSLSYVILDPASVRVSKIPEWGYKGEGDIFAGGGRILRNRVVTRDLGLPPTVEARRKILNLGEALENWRFAQQHRNTESQLIDDMLAKGEATQQRIDALYGKLPDEEIRALPGKQRISVEDPVYTRTTKAGKVLPARRRVEATPEGVERADWKRPGMNVRAMERSLEIREQNVAQVHLSIEKMRLTKETIEAELGMNSIATGDARSAIINELSQKEAMGLYDLGKFGGEGARLGDLHGDELFNLLDEGIHKWGPWMISKGGPEWNESVTDVMMASMNLNRDNLKGFVNGYDRLHNWIKANLIATPGFVMRNVMGGAFNMWFDGIPPIEVLNALKLTVKANNLGRGDMAVGAQRLIDSMEGRTVGVYGTRFTRSELDNFKVLTEAGAVHGGQAASAIEQAIIRRSRLSVTARLDAGAEGAEAVGTPITFDPRNADFFFFRAVREANTIAEESLRMGTGLFAMREGADVARSIQRIYKLHFDYSDLSDWELKWGKRVFPFYTWTRNNLPLQVEFLARNPAKYNRLFDLKRNLEWGEEKEAEGYVPDYFLEPFGVQLPFKIGDSKTYSTPDWPFQDLFRIDPSAKGWEAASNLMSGASPILKAPLEYWAGKRVFGNIPFTGRFQQVPNGFGAIPLLLPALGAAGMAKKDRAGDWVMTDKNIALVGDTLPFLNLARRAWPNEEKYQDKVVQIWVSLLGGSSLRVLTDREKWTQQIRRQMEYYKDRRDRRDIEYRRV